MCLEANSQLIPLVLGKIKEPKLGSLLPDLLGMLWWGGACGCHAGKRCFQQNAPRLMVARGREVQQLIEIMLFWGAVSI